jgi:hypothetical protein
MTDVRAGAGYDDGLIDTNASANPTIQEIIDQRYSRRQTLFGGLSALTVATLGGMVTACGGDGAIVGSGSGTVVNAGSAITTRSGKAVTLTGSTANATAGR